MKRALVVGFDAPGGGALHSRGGWAALDALTRAHVAHGKFDFPSKVSEMIQITTVWDALSALETRDQVVAALAIEQPFLYRIAQWVGVAKAWAATHGIPWYMITASAAAKQVLGDGRVGKAAQRAGFNAKQRVHAHAVAVISLAAGTTSDPRVARALSQHEADALLYALAVADKLDAQLVNIAVRGKVARSLVHSCCGCSCARCAQGHDTGARSHTPACADHMAREYQT